MRKRELLVAFCAGFLVCALAAHAQDDSPSLGDVARQARQQRQQAQAADSQNTDSQNTANQGTISQNTTGQAANSKVAPAKDASSGVPLASQATQKKDSKNSGQNKGAQSPDAAAAAQPLKTAKHVITNDEIPPRGGATGYRPSPGSASEKSPSEDPSDSQPAENSKLSASAWTSQIQAQKSNIANLQSQIQQLSDSIQYAGANCVSGCAEWNEHQKQKQDQVESMKVQLDQAQQQLEQMQETCRQQGYGSSVYDP
jgi:hypothetical protein